MGGVAQGVGGAFSHPINLLSDAVGIAGVPFTGGASLALPIITNSYSGAKAGGLGGAFGGATLGAGAGLGGSALMGTLAPSALGGIMGMSTPDVATSMAAAPSTIGISSMGTPLPTYMGGMPIPSPLAAPSSPSFASGLSTAYGGLTPISYMANSMIPNPYGQY